MSAQPYDLVPGVAPTADTRSPVVGQFRVRNSTCPGWIFGVPSSRIVAGLGDDPDAWLDGFNEQWVDAARRISPALLAELIDLAGRRFEEYVGTLDLDSTGSPVEWATGDQPAPVWLDVAREYMERYVHQQQIRVACQRPALGPEFAVPVVRTAVHSLPFSLAGVDRPTGTIVSFIVGDDQTAAWQLTSTPAGWELDYLEAGTAAVCEVRTTVDGAIRSFVRDPDAPPFTWQGDQQLAEVVSQAKAIIGR